MNAGEVEPPPRIVSVQPLPFRASPETATPVGAMSIGDVPPVIALKVVGYVPVVAYATAAADVAASRVAKHALSDEARGASLNLLAPPHAARPTAKTTIVDRFMERERKRRYDRDRDGNEVSCEQGRLELEAAVRRYERQAPGVTRDGYSVDEVGASAQGRRDVLEALQVAPRS